MDLPAARPQAVAAELEDLLGTPAADMLRISAKSGAGVQDVLARVVSDIPAPAGKAEAPLRALVFDSHYDSYRGVIAYVRVVDGQLGSRDMLQLMATGSRFEPVETGIFSPAMQAGDGLSAGEVGYVATGLKSVQECRVGDTITIARNAAQEPLPGYRQARPMVFAGIYPVNNEDYGDLRDALEKLQLNDASLSFEPETSPGAQLRFPRRLPGAVPHGDRAGKAGARIRPRYPGDSARRGIRGAAAERREFDGGQSGATAG